MREPEPGESRDGKGAGDHDTAFEFGHPQTWLSIMMQARLTILRGWVLDHRAGMPGGPADGDDLPLEEC